MFNAFKSDLRLAVAETKVSVADGLRRAMLSAVGAILAVVGTAFFTVAAWIYLARVGSPLIAALVIGGVYLCAGLVLIALGGQRRPVLAAPVAAAAAVPPPEAAKRPTFSPQQSVLPPLVEAFFVGLNTSQAMQANRRRPRRRRYEDDPDW